MQDRYAGDVGDFLTYGLLRVICAAGGGRLGVVWYLVADEAHNADGRHVGYLAAGNDLGSRLRACDPDLFERMRAIVDTRRRSVAAVERSGGLPPTTRFFAAPVPLAAGRHGLTASESGDHREAWLRDALLATQGCDTVFLDPDNGIAFDPPARSAKHARVDELAAFAQRGQSLVVYHHCDRSAAVERQAATVLDRVAAAVPSAEALAAVLARRGSVRMFVLLPQPRHRGAFTAAIEQLAGSWSPHLQPVFRS